MPREYQHLTVDKAAINASELDWVNSTFALPAPNLSLVRLFIDAQARTNYVVTPVRHARRVSELEDEEMHALYFSTAMLLSTEDPGQMRYV